MPGKGYGTLIAEQTDVTLSSNSFEVEIISKIH